MITQPVALAVFFLYLVILLIFTVYSERIMRRTKIDEYVEEFYTARFTSLLMVVQIQ